MKRKTRKRNPFLNPPLKRRAITVCPFKGAFGKSPAFQGWEMNFAANDFFTRRKRHNLENLNASLKRFIRWRDSTG